MYLSLIRDTATGSYCLGTLQAGALQFQTLELPWVSDPVGKGGKHGVSCVPPGLYELVRHDTAAHPKSFALVNPSLDVYHEPGDVPAAKQAYARTAVLLHVANRPQELLGCVGLGMHRGIGCIKQSRDAMDRFNLTVPWISGHSVGIEFAAGVIP
jgi:hypothetical protein